MFHLLCPALLTYIRANFRHFSPGNVMYVSAAYRKDYQGSVSFTIGARQAVIDLAPSECTEVLRRYEIEAVQGATISFSGLFMLTIHTVTPINEDGTLVALNMKADDNNYHVSQIMVWFHPFSNSQHGSNCYSNTE